MFYSLELQMAGVILLTAMAVGGISLWIKRRKLEKKILVNLIQIQIIPNTHIFKFNLIN